MSDQASGNDSSTEMFGFDKNDIETSKKILLDTQQKISRRQLDGTADKFDSEFGAAYGYKNDVSKTKSILFKSN